MGVLIAEPMIGGCDEKGHLRAGRWPATFATVWGGAFVLCRYKREVPLVPGLPAPLGWRELSPRNCSIVRGRFLGEEWRAVLNGSATMTAIDFGHLTLRANATQRALLARIGGTRARLREARSRWAQPSARRAILPIQGRSVSAT
jgi:hypothetical protein